MTCVDWIGVTSQRARTRETFGRVCGGVRRPTPNMRVCGGVGRPTPNMRDSHRLVLILLALIAAPVQAAPIVQFELVAERGYSATESQRWIQFLAKLDLTSIRIRQAEPNERAAITNRGTEASPVYHVVGVLTSRNRLRVPGGEFSLGDREAVAAWLKKLETDGVEGPTQKTTAFGLTAQQLVSFHETLAPAITCTSKGRRCGDVVRDIVRGLPLEYVVSDAAKRAFAKDDVCEDDLSGLAAGTSLAAVIRPLGLVFRPEKSGMTVRLWIGEVTETQEAWPVGWPSEETPVKTAPKLYEMLNADISNVALGKTLTAIQQKVAIPFLLDHNGLARQRIDLAAVKVKYPQGRAMYRRVLDNLLFQGKLSSDLRIDEAGRPFLWISPR